MYKRPHLVIIWSSRHVLKQESSHMDMPLPKIAQGFSKDSHGYQRLPMVTQASLKFLKAKISLS